MQRPLVTKVYNSRVLTRLTSTVMCHSSRVRQTLTHPISPPSSPLRQNRLDIPHPLLRELKHLPPLLRQLRSTALISDLREEDRFPLLAGLFSLPRLLPLLLFQLLLQLSCFRELLRVDRPRYPAPELQRLVLELLVLWREGLGCYG
jgi:hypothetical protein